MSNELQDLMNAFEDYLSTLLESVEEPRLKQAMYYSLMNGGKRVRPALLLATLIALQKTVDKAVCFPLASALECVHTYSLIHDDLPAMDDDDYRRGQLTNHKQFDEATAILAGDALQAWAYQLVCLLPVQDNERIDLLTALLKASGANGMIGGQMADMNSQSKPIDVATLSFIHQRKTGELLTYAVDSACYLAKAPQVVKDELHRFSQAFGLAFQIHNDLKDVLHTFEQEGKEQGKDSQLHKNTYPSLMGVDKALQALETQRTLAKEAISKAKNYLPTINDTLLLSFLNYIQ